jgi:hypothetical protein
MQSGQLGADQIGVIAHVAEACARGHGKLHGIVQARIEKRPLAVHLQIADERVPMGHRPPACPGMKIDTGQPECRWNERRRGFSIGAETLAVEKDLGIELPRPPGGEYLAHRGLFDLEQRSHRAQIGR